MIVDTHCHIDMLPSPEKYLKEMECSNVMTVGMTNRPSHYLQGKPHFERLRHSRLAIGFHPQLVSQFDSELELFIECQKSTSYIGEIGLDFSTAYICNKGLQIFALESIFNCISGQKKIISIHSRMAEKEVVEMLCKYNIATPVFHWYSGTLCLIPLIIELGGYFSINEAMTLSEKGRKIISKIPLDRILTESDAPYNHKNNITEVLKYLHIDEDVIYENFKVLLNTIR